MNKRIRESGNEKPQEQEGREGEKEDEEKEDVHERKTPKRIRKMAKMVQWQWRDKECWRDYACEENRTIEKGFLAYNAWPDGPTNTIDLDLIEKSGEIVTYKIDFVTWDQINSKSLFHRAIRRLGDPLLFPHRYAASHSPSLLCQNVSEEEREQEEREREHETRWWRTKEGQEDEDPVREPVSLFSVVGLQVQWLFRERGCRGVQVLRIERVKNPALAREHRHKGKQMRLRKGGGTTNSTLLFHGCGLQDINAITRQGFDFRLAGRNASVYGKGTYFSTKASLANQYARAPGLTPTRRMLLCSVHLGVSAQGYSGLTRPPPLESSDPDGPLFDSVADSPSTPSIYAVFDNAQAYPLYIITYRSPDEPVPLSLSLSVTSQSSQAPRNTQSLSLSSEKFPMTRTPIGPRENMGNCWCFGIVPGHKGAIRCDACQIVFHASCSASSTSDAVWLSMQDHHICRLCVFYLMMRGDLGGLVPPIRVPLTEKSRIEFLEAHEAFTHEANAKRDSRRIADELFERLRPDLAEVHGALSQMGIVYRLQRHQAIHNGRGLVEFAIAHPKHAGAKLALVIQIPQNYNGKDRILDKFVVVTGPAATFLKSTINAKIAHLRFTSIKPLVLAWHDAAIQALKPPVILLANAKPSRP